MTDLPPVARGVPPDSSPPPGRTEPVDAARELRRLRAALGASADALLTGNAGPARLLNEEAAFVSSLCAALRQPELLRETWRDLRNRALVLAADLDPTEQSLALLRSRLEGDRATTS